MDNGDVLNKAFKDLELKVRWGSMENWTDKNFRKLSEDITQLSGISISATTLKRLLGKVKMENGYQPQEATLDALAIFLDYKSWDDFKFSFYQEELSSYKKEITSLTPPKKTGNTKLYRTIGLSVIGLLLIIGLTMVIKQFITKTEQEHTAQDNPLPPNIFFADIAYSPTFPFKAVFYCDLHHDPIYHKGGNYVLTEGIMAGLTRSGINMIEHTYSNPGNYTAKAYSNNTLRCLTSILVATDGWLYGIAKGKKEWIYRPIQKKDGFLIIPHPVELFDTLAGGQADTKVLWYNKTGVNAENMRYTTEVDINDGSEGKERISLYISSQFSEIRLDLMDVNVSSKPFLRFADVRIDGRDEPFDAFIHPIKGKHTIEIHTHKKTLSVSLDNKEIFSTVYNEDMGMVTGMGFRMTQGKIDMVKIEDLDKEVIFLEEFN